MTTAETDIAGRTVKITDAAGNVQTIAYDPATGQPSVLTDALGKQTCYAYDQRGRKTAEWGTNIQTVSYGYDDADQLVKLTTYRAGTGDITTNPTGRTDGDVTTWKYDAATGLELRKTYADGTHMDKTYDSLNRLASITSPRGIITTYTYAPLTGELQTTAHSDSTPGSSASYNHLGQLATLTDPSGTRTFAYNAKGRLQQETLALNGATLNLFESYDEYGRNTAYLLNRRPSSGPVELLTSGMWRWDGSGRLTQAGIFSDREIQYSYLPGTHLLAGITLDNGVSMARSYEPHRDLITGIAYRKEDGTHLATRTYAYDALGRPTARTQQRGTETPRQDAFGYNTRSELTSASIGQAAFAYAFDNIGNRKTAQQTTEHLTYATNPLNQYTSITPQQQPAFAPAFDADGNQTRLCTTTGEWNIVYDANNRPIRFTKVDGSVIVENGYDSMGRRYMQKVTENGTVTRHERYLYRGYLQIAALDILHGGKQKHALFWDPTEPLATRPLILLASDDNRYTYAHDLTKNVTELIDEQGNIAAAYDYDLFGTVTATGPAAHLNPIQWSSEIYDPELALVYYNYRHYNPTDGRWINRDPIAERGGFNLYGFARNMCSFFSDYLGQKIIIVSPLQDGDPLNGGYQTSPTAAEIAYTKKYLADLDNLPEGCFERSVKAGYIKFNYNVFKGTKAQYRELISRELGTRHINIKTSKLDEIKKILQDAVKECSEPHDQVIFLAHGIWSYQSNTFSGMIGIGNDYVKKEIVDAMLAEVGNVRLASCYIDNDYAIAISLMLDMRQSLAFGKNQEAAKSVCGAYFKPFAVQFYRGEKKGPLDKGVGYIPIN